MMDNYKKEIGTFFDAIKRFADNSPVDEMKPLVASNHINTLRMLNDVMESLLRVEKIMYLYEVGKIK